MDDTSKEQRETPTDEKEAIEDSDISSKPVVKRIQVTEENIEQKRLDTSSTKKVSLGSSTKKTSYLPKELKFLRACMEVNAYPSPQEKAELGARLNQEVNSIGYWFTNERRRREKLGVKNTRAEEGMVSFKDITSTSFSSRFKDFSLTSF